MGVLRRSHAFSVVQRDRVIACDKSKINTTCLVTAGFRAKTNPALVSRAARLNLPTGRSAISLFTQLERRCYGKNRVAYCSAKGLASELSRHSYPRRSVTSFQTNLAIRCCFASYGLLGRRIERSGIAKRRQFATAACDLLAVRRSEWFTFLGHHRRRAILSPYRTRQVNTRQQPAEAHGELGLNFAVSFHCWVCIAFRVIHGPDASASVAGMIMCWPAGLR